MTSAEELSSAVDRAFEVYQALMRAKVNGPTLVRAWELYRELLGLYSEIEKAGGK